jgi:hypothetical protein
MIRKTRVVRPILLGVFGIMAAGAVMAQDQPEPKGGDLALLEEIRVLARRMTVLRETSPALDPPPIAVRATSDLIGIAAEIRGRSLVPAEQLAARDRAWADLGFPRDDVPTRALTHLAGDIAGVGLDAEGNRLLVDVDRMTDADFFSEQPNDPTIAFLLGTGVRPDEPTMVHALMHLVQHERGRTIQETTTDALLAAAALEEGEANLVAVMYLFKAMGLERNILALGYTPDQALNGALMPTALEGAASLDRQILDFVYMDGFEALSWIWQAAGWEGVDRFIARSRATHDLLHMDRPPARTPLPEPAIPDLPAGYKERDRDSLGELGIVMLINALTGKENLGPQAGDGWLADRVVRLEPDSGENGVTVWKSLWRSDPQAEEFLELYRRGLSPVPGLERIVERNGREVQVLVIPTALHRPDPAPGTVGSLHP